MPWLPADAEERAGRTAAGSPGGRCLWCWTTPATGELLRDLILDPTRNYQPPDAHPAHHPQPHANARTPSPSRGFGVIPIS